MDVERSKFNLTEAETITPGDPQKDSLKEYDVRPLRLDKRGLPLAPQPTVHKDDPLNWSPWLKIIVALQISWLAALGPLGSGVINPAFVPLSKAFGITPVQASYELTVNIVFGGIGPLLIVPFANVYGRRPVYLLGNLIAGITNVAAGYCDSWPGIMITRGINGFSYCSSLSLGGATICDLFFQHERGLYMGIYTFCLTNGPHFAALIGGFVAKYLGWQECWKIPAWIQLGTFVITLFTLPETLYSRKVDQIEHPYRPRTYTDLLLFRGNHHVEGRRVKGEDFMRPFQMLRYWAVVLPALYYMTCFSWGSVIFATTGSQLFGSLYHFTTVQTGLMLSIPLLIGSAIGEFNAGWVTDWLSNRYAAKHDGERLPEARLDAIWGALLVPIGIIIEGVCLSHTKTVSWVGSAFGMGIACLGLQIATTVVYAYTTDCYKPQSAELSVLMNTFRQIFSCLVSFYAIPFGERIGYEYAWLVFALINLLFLMPVLALRVYGPRWRALASQAPPTFHNDI